MGWGILVIEVLVNVNPPSPTMCQWSRNADNQNVTHTLGWAIPMCLRGGRDSFLSLPRPARRLGVFSVLGDDLFNERITKGGHHIGHHFWFGVLSQERHMRYSGFLGKK